MSLTELCSIQALLKIWIRIVEGLWFQFWSQARNARMRIFLADSQTFKDVLVCKKISGTVALTGRIKMKHSYSALEYIKWRKIKWKCSIFQSIPHRAVSVQRLACCPELELPAQNWLFNFHKSFKWFMPGNILQLFEIRNNFLQFQS